MSQDRPNDPREQAIKDIEEAIQTIRKNAALIYRGGETQKYKEALDEYIKLLDIIAKKGGIVTGMEKRFTAAKLAVDEAQHLHGIPRDIAQRDAMREIKMAMEDFAKAYSFLISKHQAAKEQAAKEQAAKEQQELIQGGADLPPPNFGAPPPPPNMPFPDSAPPPPPIQDPQVSGPAAPAAKSATAAEPGPTAKPSIKLDLSGVKPSTPGMKRAENSDQIQVKIQKELDLLSKLLKDHTSRNKNLDKFTNTFKTAHRYLSNPKITNDMRIAYIEKVRATVKQEIEAAKGLTKEEELHLDALSRQLRYLREDYKHEKSLTSPTPAKAANKSLPFKLFTKAMDATERGAKEVAEKVEKIVRQGPGKGGSGSG